MHAYRKSHVAWSIIALWHVRRYSIFKRRISSVKYKASKAKKYIRLSDFIREINVKENRINKISEE